MGNEDLTPAHPTREFKIGDVVWLVGEQESLKELCLKKLMHRASAMYYYIMYRAKEKLMA